MVERKKEILVESFKELDEQNPVDMMYNRNREAQFLIIQPETAINTSWNHVVIRQEQWIN